MMMMDDDEATIISTEHWLGY